MNLKDKKFRYFSCFIAKDTYKTINKKYEKQWKNENELILKKKQEFVERTHFDAANTHYITS